MIHRGMCMCVHTCVSSRKNVVLERSTTNIVLCALAGVCLSDCLPVHGQIVSALFEM